MIFFQIQCIRTDRRYYRLELLFIFETDLQKSIISFRSNTNASNYDIFPIFFPFDRIIYHLIIWDVSDCSYCFSCTSVCAIEATKATHLRRTNGRTKYIAFWTDIRIHLATDKSNMPIMFFFLLEWFLYCVQAKHPNWYVK